MALRSRIIGCGSYLPKRVLTNRDLEALVETSDDWIVERTGIRQRHIAAEGETTSDLALAAAKEALKDAGVEAGAVDLIVLATATPDYTFPATAVKVQAALGLTGGVALDVQAVCSGFIYALSVADAMMRTSPGGKLRTALVIGAETFSRILDWEDRSTCVLFGDGAGAVVLRLSEQEQAEQEQAEQEQETEGGRDAGILSCHLHSDGRYHDMLYVDGGPSATRTTGHLRMSGREVFRHAVVNLAEVVEEALAANGLTSSDIDWIVPHQANRRILDSTARKLKISPEKVIVTVEKHANTSAASIPLALDAAIKDGRIQAGHLLVLEAMGGGFTWGACLVRL